MTSDVHVMVQAINTHDKSTDSFTVLPVEDLGTDHVVAVYRQPYTGWSLKCSFLDGLPPVSSAITVLLEKAKLFMQFNKFYNFQ